MGGANKGFISYRLIGKRRIINIPPTPYFYMVNNTYSQSGLGITGAKPTDDEHVTKYFGEAQAKNSGI